MEKASSKTKAITLNGENNKSARTAVEDHIYRPFDKLWKNKGRAPARLGTHCPQPRPSLTFRGVSALALKQAPNIVPKNPATDAGATLTVSSECKSVSRAAHMPGSVNAAGYESGNSKAIWKFVETKRLVYRFLENTPVIPPVNLSSLAARWRGLRRFVLHLASWWGSGDLRECLVTLPENHLYCSCVSQSR
jgi:hypothetical protein